VDGLFFIGASMIAKSGYRFSEKITLKPKPKETTMKSIALVFISFFLVTAAFAEDSCKVQATGKSLHGAALASFAKKCCKDQAAAQKLHGAAETSFTKKCVSDATAS
jgi:hypothetical protein